MISTLSGRRDVARRRREDVQSADAPAVLDDDDRVGAATIAFVKAGGCGVSLDWDGADGRWWDRWVAGGREAWLRGPAARADHLEAGIGRLDATAIYQRELDGRRAHKLSKAQRGAA